MKRTIRTSCGLRPTACVGIGILQAVSVLILGAQRGDGAEVTPDEFRQAVAAKAEALAKADVLGMKGQDGFCFLGSDLRHYGKGPFWGEHAEKASVSEQNKDPLAAILDFHAQLRKAGVKLVFVPVPGKTVTYPDKLDPKLTVTGRADAAHQVFYELLRKDGIEVEDLLPEFLKMRKDGAEAHCRQDAHWTPEAMGLAARKVAARIKAEAWYSEVPKKRYDVSTEPIEFAGDTVRMMKDAGEIKDVGSRETSTVRRVSLAGGAVESDRQSPVLLIGDSHAVVYHEPIDRGIAASGAGLFEQLAAELGFAPELVANLGSGANAPRMTLARPPRWDNLAGKKYVIWCLTVRELTESSQGWMKIPVVRERKQ